MYSFETLDITGYRGEPVPNTFLKQDAGAEHLALVLPGMGYTCDMPLLYYSAKLLLLTGADMLLVEYSYDRRQDFRDATSNERERWLVADVDAAYRAAVGQGVYRRMTVIGKSIGTIAMGHLLTAQSELPLTQAVWLTPALRYPGVLGRMRSCGGQSLIVIGTGDPDYDPGLLSELEATHDLEIMTIQAADHSLEIEGDVMASLEALARIIGAAQQFMNRDQEISR